MTLSTILPIAVSFSIAGKASNQEANQAARAESRELFDTIACIHISEHRHLATSRYG